MIKFHTVVALVLLAASAIGLTCAVSVFKEPASTDAAPAPAVHKRALVMLTGAHSKAKRAIELARTEPHFIKLWQRHLGEKETGNPLSIYNPLGVPTVDFDRCMVLTLFGGDSWNSAGYYVDSIFERDGNLVVRYDDRSYQTSGKDGGGEKVSPYGFIVLEKSSKKIVLEKNVQGLIRGEPIWKETASFPAL